jgi:prepilin-type N-terminal cleavage/methylation domain-containing protein
LHPRRKNDLQKMISSRPGCQFEPSVLRQRRGVAFTLVELLVVIAILAVLAATLLPALARVTERTSRATCKGNLRRIGTILQIYSQDNNNLLPDLRYPPYASQPPFSAGLWPWDISTNLINTAIKYGGSRDVFYCPSNPEFNCDATWNFGIAGTGDDAFGGFRITGYVWLLPGEGSRMTAIPYPETPWWKTNLLGVPGKLAPADAEMVVDVVVRDAVPPYSYTRIVIGGLSGSVVQRTSHLNGPLPSGANIVFEDTHVGWRQFNDMWTLPGFGGPVPIHPIGGGGVPTFMY